MNVRISRILIGIVLTVGLVVPPLDAPASVVSPVAHAVTEKEKETKKKQQQKKKEAKEAKKSKKPERQTNKKKLKQEQKAKKAERKRADKAKKQRDPVAHKAEKQQQKRDKKQRKRQYKEAKKRDAREGIVHEDLRDCKDFDSQQAAQRYFASKGGPSQDPSGLDRDGDGNACEAL